jgi:hypothetical protein
MVAYMPAFHRACSHVLTSYFPPYVLKVSQSPLPLPQVLQEDPSRPWLTDVSNILDMIFHKVVYDEPFVFSLRLSPDLYYGRQTFRQRFDALFTLGSRARDTTQIPRKLKEGGS